VSRPVVVVTRRVPEEVEAELAQDFDVRVNADDHPFTPDELKEALRTADGLLPTNVRSIAQTRDGYVWLAAFDGFVRFDGARAVGGPV